MECKLYNILELGGNPGSGNLILGEIICFHIRKDILNNNNEIDPHKLCEAIVLLESNLNIRKSGSAALDMAYVASGRFDGFFQDELNIWDIAAGVILVNEAGGKINNIDYSSIEDIKVIASSNSIYEKMLENINNF